jgi:hypothetical protein
MGKIHQHLYGLLILILLLSPYRAASTAYYVSTEGDDANPGTLTSPRKTIQSGISLLVPGDTLWIRGGRYHEEVLISNHSGLPGSEIVISGYPGETVLLDGTIPIESDWELYQGNIYRTSIESDIWQLFVDGRMQVVARWPNASTHPVDPIAREPGRWEVLDGTWWSRSTTWASADASGTFNGVVENDPSHFDLAATGKSFQGGSVILSVLEQGGDGNQERLITHHEAGSSTFQHPVVYPPKPDKAYRNTGKFYIIEHLEVLDQQEEWYFIDSTNTIYLRAKEDMDPNLLEVRGRNQVRGMKLLNSSYIKIRGIDFFASNISVLGEHVSIEDCNFNYPDASKRLVGSYPNTSDDASFNLGNHIDGEYFSLVNCEFRHTAYNVLKVENGTASLIDNNLFYHISMLGLGKNGAIEQVNTYTRNTLITSGCRGGIKTNAGPKEVMNHSYNLIDGFGYMQVPDGAALQANSAHTPGANRSYNWFLNSPKFGSRWDGRPAGKGGINHHSVGVQMRGALQIKGDEHHNYNNSCFDAIEYNDIILLSDPEFGGNTGTFTFNNLADRISGHREEDVASYPLPGTHDHNWNGYKTGRDANLQVYDVENRDFRPRPGSDLVDAGQVIPGITDGFSEIRPDIGAYEFGDTLYWIPGRRTARASGPVPADQGSSRYQFVDLMWLEGYSSLSSDIYFGTSMEAVESAGFGSAEYMGNQVFNIFTPGFLSSGHSFYWRIDAVGEDTLVKGEVWSFTASVDANPEVFRSMFKVTGIKEGKELTLEGAVIRMGDRRAVADSSGMAEFIMLPEGRYAYTVSLQGYEDHSDTIDVPSDTTIVLLKAIEDFQVRLNIVNRSTNVPVYRALVTYKNLLISTNQSGVAILEHLPYGTVAYTVEHNDYFPIADSILVRKDTSLKCTMTPRLAELQLEITDGSLPVAGAAVHLEGSSSRLSDEQGLVRYTNRPARVNYHYEVSMEGYAPLSDSLYLEEDTTLKITLLPITDMNHSSTSVFQFFPNPAEDRVHVHIACSGTVVRLLGTTGKILLEEKFGEGDHVMDISSQEPGMYILEAEAPEFKRVHRLVKQ